MNNKVNLLEMSHYYEIICGLIYDKKVTSKIKIIFLAFAIKNMEDYFQGSKKEYGLIDDILTGIKYGLQKNFEQFKMIFDCFELLKRKGMVCEKKNLFLATNTPKFTKTNKVLESPMIIRAISQVEKLSDESLIRSVIENV